MPGAVADKETWELAEGDEIAPGRSVLKLLGGGHRYEVYLVWDDKLFAVMVAKVLRPDLAGDESALRGLRREFEALDQLSHPVLMRGFGADLEGRYPHVLVEHLEGPTLRRLIRRGGPLPLEQVLPLGLNIASVVHYLASEGWVHLDIKPDNLVMGLPPRLIDLSLARTVERARKITGYIGTNAYMPPEQCAPGEAGEIGPPSDVWGLGATLYHAIAGKRPFPRPESIDDDAPLEVRFPQLVEEPRPWPVRVPPELSEAVLATLAKDPARRPTAAELAESLQPLVAALPRKLVLGRRGPRLP
ncbi:MAG TPA: serine/threonine-protein kinase [Thermoleophilaceae bacterium]|nr:serine/threonine-protein kinase [Thermoleophilaceae bacterium]